MTQPRKDPEALTDFEERFCLEYPKDLNGTLAMKRAGFRGKKTSAAVEASKLLKNPNVVGKIRTLMKERDERVQIDSDEVLREMARLGYSDLRGLYNDDGTIKHPKEWPDELARAVASIEVEELFEGSGENRTWIGYTKKVKLWPKNHAIEMMAKHKKLMTDKVEHSGTVTLADLVAGPKEGKD